MIENFSENEIIDYYMKLGYSINQANEIINFAKQNYDIALKLGVTDSLKSWCYLLCKSFNLVPKSK